ncbi:tRNA pseudouridine(55) synthase TruB [Thermomonospora catenispora]|uniref:tRNA pseudouridine(55) synthase TruB n=1 Tax=Thermomonospora catenispora TaxID=2493090 RepID=UPI00111E7DAD|nr:tRNA pseudouridine(55) synthase TruB [Thermomonospora catenispora]TNY34635.1 tRNA pseudouridine(55) synthase TruB [Thermomonospora catenispora]
MTSGLVIVDKPAEWTSHDVVARMRRLAGTRKVGHAGTLDPMATGVLVVGVGKATRLLGHLALTEKTYRATIRLGQSTDTDDAEGEITATASAAGVTDADLRAAIETLTGEIMQVPPQVSAIKVNGRRAYRMARKGEDVELAARPVTVREFTVEDVRREGELVDVDAVVTCSSGTYIRALARDLGAALGTGGHLTALRRTRVGPYGLERARTLDQLAERLEILPIGDAVAAAFPRREVTAEQARRVVHGGRLPAAGLGPGPVGVFAPDGTLLALVEERGGVARPLAVFAGE